MNFSTNDEVGLLVKGFDTPPFVMMTHNPPYYLNLLENAGLQKSMDLFAYYLEVTKPPERITRLTEKKPGEIAALFEKFKTHGINTLFFRVFQNPGDAFFRVLPRHAREGVYFKTRYAPVVSDLLPVICRIAHKKGLKIYAWMNTLRATFIRCSNSCKRVFLFDIHKGRIAAGRTMSPFDTRVRRCLRGLYADLAKNPIDGILIQDDLILHYSEDMSPAAIRKFKKDSGLKKFKPERLYILGKNRDGETRLEGYQDAFWKWSTWKSRQLALLLKELTQVIKHVNPKLRTGLNVNYESLLAPENALAWFSRDIPTLEKIARPDYYVVMSYQRQMQRELKKTPEVVLGDIRAMVKTAVAIIPDPGRWIFKVQTIDWKTRHPISQKQIRKVLATIQRAAPVHHCLMPYIPQLLAGKRMARACPSKY
jgi:biofilm PGA synthesis lipoprotein PgaB